MIRFWKSSWLNPRAGYDIIVPMSPSTLKIEHHDPGGLTRGKALTEIGINVGIVFGLVEVAFLFVPDPVFGVIIGSAAGFFFPAIVISERLRFKIFRREPPSVKTSYKPECIPPEMVARYEKAMTDLAQINQELEEVAAANGIEWGAALKRSTNDGD